MFISKLDKFIKINHFSGWLRREILNGQLQPGLGLYRVKQIHIYVTHINSCSTKYDIGGL